MNEFLNKLKSYPKQIVISVVVFLILIIGIYSTVSKRKDTPSVSQNQSDQIKKETWTCPMHPQIRKDGPGKCPICGMDLVKVNPSASGSMSQAQMPEGHAPFTLSNTQQQLIGVKLGVVEKKTLFKSIDVAGRVAFDPELYTAQNEYLESLRQLGNVQESPLPDVRHSAERMVQSAKLRLKILGLSDQQIANLGNRGSAGANLLITSPGENIWVYAEVYEMDLPHVKPGLEAKISSPFVSLKNLKGKVVSVDRVINPTTRTAKVRILVSQAKVQLRPEAYVDVVILAPLGEEITVPMDAVLDTGKESWVFISDGKGNYEPRLMTEKFRTGDQVAIATGIHAGEKIVTSANFLIDSESRLKGVLSSQGTPPAQEQEDSSSKKPECPKGQEWHEQMKHCMPKVGG